MSKRNSKRGKHIPQRTCVGCRKVQSKREMVRIVRTLDGIKIEQDEKLSGRGAYLHQAIICWEKAVSKKLADALKTTLSSDDKDTLQQFMNSMEPAAENGIKETEKT